LQGLKELPLDSLRNLLLLLFPFAPHISEELWSRLGHDTGLMQQSWPKPNKELLAQIKVTVVIQVNGRFRGSLKVKAHTAEAQVVTKAKKMERVQRALADNKIKKTVFVPDKVINFITD